MLNNFIDKGFFSNHPLLIKAPHKDTLNIRELFWDVKMEDGILGWTQKYNEHETSTYFTPQL